MNINIKKILLDHLKETNPDAVYEVLTIGSQSSDWRIWIYANTRRNRISVTDIVPDISIKSTSGSSVLELHISICKKSLVKIDLKQPDSLDRLAETVSNILGAMENEENSIGSFN